MRRWMFACAIVFLIAVPTAADDAKALPSGRQATLRPELPDKIINRVIDLLDEDVLLDSETDRTSWESEPFDTSQYTRIGLRADADAEGAWIQCVTLWQFARDDEFLALAPGFSLVQPILDPVVDPRQDDVRRLYYLGNHYFTEVFGLRAKVRCGLAGVDLGMFPEDPVPVTGTIRDVKVLLRRE